MVSTSQTKSRKFRILGGTFEIANAPAMPSFSWATGSSRVRVRELKVRNPRKDHVQLFLSHDVWALSATTIKSRAKGSVTYLNCMEIL